MRNPDQSGTSTSQSESKSVKTVHTSFLPIRRHRRRPKAMGLFSSPDPKPSLQAHDDAPAELPHQVPMPPPHQMAKDPLSALWSACERGGSGSPSVPLFPPEEAAWIAEWAGFTIPDFAISSGVLDGRNQLLVHQPPAREQLGDQPNEEESNTQ